MAEKIRYTVYCDGDLQAEFDTLQEAKAYMKLDIKGMAECYGKTQKEIKKWFTWTIEKVYYKV